MGLLPNTPNCWCACAGNAGNVFPTTVVKQSRHASRHVRHARAVMHAGIANSRFPLNSAVGENVPGIPGACTTRNFAHLVRGPFHKCEKEQVVIISAPLVLVLHVGWTLQYLCRSTDVSSDGHQQRPGPWFNIKMSYQYRKYHCGDKTVVRSSYLHNGISHTGKISSLYWMGAQYIISTTVTAQKIRGVSNNR